MRRFMPRLFPPVRARQPTSLTACCILSCDVLKATSASLIAPADGAPSPTYDEAVMSAYMKNPEIDITVHVASGRASATVWTCDLTKAYVEINGDYRS